MKIKIKNKYIFWLLRCIEFLIFDIFTIFIVYKLFNKSVNSDVDIFVFISISIIVYIIYTMITNLYASFYKFIFNIDDTKLDNKNIIKVDDKEIDINGLDTYVATWQQELKICILYRYNMKVLSKKFNIINYKLFDNNDNEVIMADNFDITYFLEDLTVDKVNLVYFSKQKFSLLFKYINESIEFVRAEVYFKSKPEIITEIKQINNTLFHMKKAEELFNLKFERNNIKDKNLKTTVI